MSTEKPENEEEKVEETQAEAPAAEAKEETPAPEVKEEVPATEEAPAEEAKAEEASAEEAPAEEAPVAEEAKEEAPAKEAKAEEAPKEEAAPKKEEAKAEAAEGEGEAKAEEKKEDTTVQDLLGDDLGDIKVRRAKGSKNITHGIVHVVASFNNTKVSVTDMKGNVISWSSAGKCNFRGSRKSTAYAAQVVTQDATRAAMAHGLKEVEVHLKGPGMGRDSAVRALQALGMIIVSIVDKTPVPHNGCRPPKRRRV